MKKLYPFLLHLSALSSSLSQWKLDTNEIRGYVSDNDNNMSVTCQLLNIQQQNIHNHNTFLTQHFLTKVVSSVTQLFYYLLNEEIKVISNLYQVTNFLPSNHHYQIGFGHVLMTSRK